MYSWGGGVGQKFPNDEATKVFAIRKMKKQFTNKNTHILRIDVLQKHAVQEHAVLFFIGGLRTWAEGPRKFLNLESLKCHFLDFGEF
jgi:hypothetical protein